MPATGQLPRYRVRIPKDKLDLLVGATLENRYYVLSVLGKGGMSLVYKAKDLKTSEIVAVKTLRTQALADEMIVKRFQREAEVLNRLNHPRIVQIFSYGTSKRGHPYFVMDYLIGTSLGEVLRTGGAMELERFQNIFVQVSAAIGHAHKHGAIHRDVKPGNIMLVTKGGATDYVKIVDFGIAKLAEEAQKLTRVGEVWGSPIYMSPEQCMGSTTIDARTDIYSLGIVMYEALTGEVPFLGRSYVDTMARQISEPPAPFSEIAPQLAIPASLEAIVFKAIQKSPDDRYQTMGDMKHDLERALSPQAASQEASQKGSLFGLFKNKQKTTAEHADVSYTAEPPYVTPQPALQQTTPLGSTPEQATPVAEPKPFQLTGPNVIAATEPGNQDFSPPPPEIEQSGLQQVLERAQRAAQQRRTESEIEATILPTNANRGYIKPDPIEATIAPENARAGSAQPKNELQPDQEASTSGQRRTAGPRQSGNRLGAQNQERAFDASPGGDVQEQSTHGKRHSPSRNPRGSSPRNSKNRITGAQGRSAGGDTEYGDKSNKRANNKSKKSGQNKKIGSRSSSMASVVLKIAIALMALLAGFGLASSPTVRDLMVKLVFEKETEKPELPTSPDAGTDQWTEVPKDRAPQP